MDIITLIVVSLNGRPVSGKRKKRSAFAGSVNLNMNFRSYKCFYENCVVPPDPSTLPPPDKRPDDFVLWSNASTWGNDTLPQQGDSVTIEKGRNICIFFDNCNEFYNTPSI